LIDKILVRDPQCIVLINKFLCSLVKNYDLDVLQKTFFIDRFPVVFFSRQTLSQLRNIDYFKILQNSNECSAFELKSIKEQQLLLPLDQYTDFSKLNLFDTKIDTSKLYSSSKFLKTSQFRYCFEHWRILPSLKIKFEKGLTGKEILDNIEHLDANFVYYYTIDDYTDFSYFVDHFDEIFNDFHLNYTFADIDDLAFAKLQTQY
jgi:hypothetical protein